MLIETKKNFVPALEFFEQIFKEEEERYFKNLAKAQAKEDNKENNKENVSSCCR